MAGVPLKRRRRPGCLRPPKRLFGLVNDVATRKSDVMQVPVGPLCQLTPLALTLAPGMEGLAELGEKARTMIIYHRFMCASGHFNLLKLNCCREYEGYPGFRQTTLCTASDDKNSSTNCHEMNARLPSLNGLRAFEAAARHLSFTNAASELNVTQTPITHPIRPLQPQLRLRLLVPHNPTLPPQPEAREYVPGVRA